MTDDFRLELKPTTKSTPFMGSKDEWTQRSKSMKNVLYV